MEEARMIVQPQPTVGDTSWFVQDRFGMFIHWGLYALAARHEWVKSREEIDNAGYQKYFDHFDPDLYDPQQWARVAREAGMKYMVITSKHHDGFSLWDSRHTDYKATNTPYGKDLLRPLVDAFRAEGLRVGFYYSLIDWHHPHFPIDVKHPLRDHPDALEMNKKRDIARYAEYLHAQVNELLTIFELDILWLDFSYPDSEYKGMPGKGCKDWRSEELYRMIRELAPNIIINNRMDLQDVAPDIYTPEQYQPTAWLEVDGQPVVWETCQTFSGSWGYYRDEATWKSPEQLIRMLINTVSCGGNLLMNVGPTARGTFDDRALRSLRVYANWMRLHSRSIYGCTQSDFAPPPDVRYTQTGTERSRGDGDRLYVHIYAWPFRHLLLPGLAGKVAYAQLLNDASEIPFRDAGSELGLGDETLPPGSLLLTLPVVKPDVVVPVVELLLN
ncbi:alpha-L-fucosidase [Chloroflexota bacterium]